MKITTRDKKLLFIAGGLVLFLVVYMYVFTPLQEKTNQMQSQIEHLERECEALEMQNADIAAYQEQIEVYRAAISETMKLFPADVKEEDILVYLMDLQEVTEIELLSMGFNEPAPVVEFDGVVAVNGQDKMVHMHGQQISATTTAEFSYEDMKEVLNYIYETKAQTTLESITVVYDANREVLNGTLDFSKYALTYEDAVYTPEKLPEVEIGQEDLFGDN